MSSAARKNVSLVERLGFKATDKLLIVNADDAGMCHAVNAGIERAFAAGLLSSCTVMAACPWFGDFAARARRNRNIRTGVHLMATSEWLYYRWGPVSPAERVPSLVDEHGCFFHSLEEFHERARPAEVEIEFRAQIERCLAAGLELTHLDSHMGVYHFKEELFAVARKLAEEYRLTLRIGYPPRAESLQAEGWGVVDRLFFETHDEPLEQRRRLYTRFLDDLAPGVTELVIHPAEPTEELRAIGGMWQRRGFDLEFFTNLETREMIQERGIHLIGYDRLLQLTRQNMAGS